MMQSRETNDEARVLAKSPPIGEMNGIYKACFKLCLLTLPVFMASSLSALGYVVSLTRDHDQRIKGLESQQQERLMLVEDFRKIRDSVPSALSRIDERLSNIERRLVSIEEAQKKTRS